MIDNLQRVNLGLIWCVRFWLSACALKILEWEKEKKGRERGEREREREF